MTDVLAIFARLFIFFPFISAILSCFFTRKSAVFFNLLLLAVYFSLGLILVYFFVSENISGFSLPIGHIPYEFSVYNNFYIFIILFSFLSFILYNKSYFVNFDSYIFFFLWSYIAGLVCLIVSYDAFNLFVSLEIVSLSSYVLVGIFDKNKDSIIASYHYIFYGVIASSFLLFGLSCIYNEIGSVNIEHIHSLIQNSESGISLYLFLGICLVGIGLFIKIGLFPFLVWMVRVYQFSSIKIIILISSLTAFCVLVSFTKIFFYIPATISSQDSIIQHGSLMLLVANLLFYLSCISIIILSLWAIKERIYKKVLAISSSITMSYLVGIISLFIISQDSAHLFPSENLLPYKYDLGTIFYVSLLCIIINHCFTKQGLFMIGDICKASSFSDKKSFISLWHKNPIISIFFIFFALSLIGIPPALVGFLGKAYFYFFIFLSSSPMHFVVLAISFFCSGVAGIIYLGKFVSVIFDPPSDNIQEMRPSSWQYIALLFNVVSCCIIASCVFIYVV